MEDDLTRVAQDSARGGFFLISGSAIATLISAIASILIARFLGPELYGQYALALVAPQLLFLFTDLGLSQAITKFTSTMKSKSETNRISTIIKHGMIIRGIIGIVIFALNYLLAETIATYMLQRPDLTFYIQIASTYVLFQVIITTASAAFVGLDRTEYQAIATNTQAIAKAIISISLIIAGLSITGAIIGYTLSYAASALVAVPLLWIILHQNKNSGKNDSFKANLLALFRYGSPLYLSILLTGFVPLFINVILAFFVADLDIGNYKAAINFAALLSVLAVPITTVLLPAFSKLNHLATHKISYFFQLALKYAAMIIIPVSFLIIIFSNEIVQIIYGSTYQLTPLYLSTYILVYFLVGLGYLILPSLYNGLGETRTTLKMSLTTFTTLLLLSVPLTQIYGVQGVIAAFIISNMAGSVYGAWKAKKKYQVHYDIKNTAKIYIISGVSTVVPIILIQFTGLSGLFKLALGGCIFCFTYVTLMPLTNIVSSIELDKITVAIRNMPMQKQIINPIIRYQQKIFKLKKRSQDPTKSPE